MSRVKGSAVLSRLQYLEEKHGASAKGAVLDALSEEQRIAIATGILPHEWASYDLFIALNVEIDRRYGKGDLGLCFEMGKFGAEHNLPTLYKIFYRLGSPMFIFNKAARLWEVHYDSGRMVPIPEGKTTIRTRIVDFDRPHRAHCLSVMGWGVRSIELSGCKVTFAEEEKCRTRGDGLCEFLLRWE